MSSLPQDELAQQIESGRKTMQKCLQFIQDNEFFERLLENPDWVKARESLTKERSGLITKRDELLKTLVETRGTDKVNIQDGILECQIRLDQTDAFLDWFTLKVKNLKDARDTIIVIKEELLKLQGESNG